MHIDLLNKINFDWSLDSNNDYDVTNTTEDLIDLSEDSSSTNNRRKKKKKKKKRRFRRFEELILYLASSSQPSIRYILFT